MDIKEFFRQPPIQKLLEEENLEEIYHRVRRNERGELSNFLLNSGIDPMNYFNHLIPEMTFNDCQNLVNVVIPDKIVIIGESAFSYCQNLESVTLPNTIKSIGEGAFCDCFKLKSILLPQGIFEICRDTFANCNNLTSIIVPENVRRIGHAAFTNCFNLKDITIGKGVRYIDEYAFLRCGAYFITYNNTRHEWSSACRFKNWRKNSNIKEVRCTDGVITYDD